MLVPKFQIFREARRTSPSILYLPHIQDWWDVIGDTLRATFLTLLHDLEPSAPTLLIATCEVHHGDLSEQVTELNTTTSPCRRKVLIISLKALCCIVSPENPTFIIYMFNPTPADSVK